MSMPRQVCFFKAFHFIKKQIDFFLLFMIRISIQFESLEANLLFYYQA
jgi:hypothetical protein